METGQVVRKEIQRAFNFVWKIMFSSMLLNIILFLPNKSSTSNYCPNALLKLRFWPLFWNLLLLLPLPDCCPLKLLLLSHCPLMPRLPSHCPQKLWYPSYWPSSSGCSVATESCQHCESCHFSCTSVTEAVGMSNFSRGIFPTQGSFIAGESLPSEPPGKPTIKRYF